MGMQREELLSAHKARTIAISQLETDFNTSCQTHVHEGYIYKQSGRLQKIEGPNAFSFMTTNKIRILKEHIDLNKVR